jgi:hypothetical protein
MKQRQQQKKRLRRENYRRRCHVQLSYALVYTRKMMVTRVVERREPTRRREFVFNVTQPTERMRIQRKKTKLSRAKRDDHLFVLISNFFFLFFSIIQIKNVGRVFIKCWLVESRN